MLLPDALRRWGIGCVARRATVIGAVAGFPVCSALVMTWLLLMGTLHSGLGAETLPFLAKAYGSRIACVARASSRSLLLVSSDSSGSFSCLADVGGAVSMLTVFLLDRRRPVGISASVSEGKLTFFTGDPLGDRSIYVRLEARSMRFAGVHRCSTMVSPSSPEMTSRLTRMLD
jgi:hypothetical protein